MTQIDQQNNDQKLVRPADRSVWLIWLGMVLLAVAILPFAVRNSEIVRQIAAMCGFTLELISFAPRSFRCLFCGFWWQCAGE